MSQANVNLISLNFNGGFMQDYAALFPKNFNPGPKKKLCMIRQVLRSGVSKTLMLIAITVIMEGMNRK
jgi:hypothetical protein